MCEPNLWGGGVGGWRISIPKFIGEVPQLSLLNQASILLQETGMESFFISLERIKQFSN